MLLTSILGVPFVVGLLCLFARPRRAVGVPQHCRLRHRVGPRREAVPDRAGEPGQRGERVERIPARRRPQRVDGAAHLGRVAGDRALRRALLPPRSGRRRADGRPRAGILRAHAAVRGRHVARRAGQQSRRDVVCRGSHRAVLRPARRALQPPDFARSRLEIHHPRQPRPGAGAVGHGVPVRGGRWPARVRKAAQLQLVAPDDRGAAVRPRPHQAGLRVCADRLRHQGRARPHAYLAARRAQRGARRPPARCFRACRSRLRSTPCCGSTFSPRPACTPTSAAIFSWAWACSPCSSPRRSFSCRRTSNGCSPIRASNTSASSAPALP